MPDRLTGIEVFVCAVRQGGLSAAGRKLGMSPAMAGKHLDALERRLGVSLVRRTTRALSLTEAGRQFVGEAERLLAELTEAEMLASAKRLVVDGVLRVSTPVSFGVMHIAPLIDRFCSQHPKASIELGLNDRYVNIVEEEWDVAIRVGRSMESGLIARKLAPISSVVCASPEYLTNRGTPQVIDDLVRHNCLGYTLSKNAGGRNTWTFGQDGDVTVPVRGNLYANNGEAIVAAAIAGQGLVYGPRFIAANALESGALVEVALDVPLYNIGAAYALTHPDRRPTIKTRAWITYLTECLKGLRI